MKFRFCAISILVSALLPTVGQAVALEVGATAASTPPPAASRVPRRMDEFSGELPGLDPDRPPMYQGRFGVPGRGPRRCCHETRDGQMYCH